METSCDLEIYFEFADDWVVAENAHRIKHVALAQLLLPEVKIPIKLKKIISN